MSEEQFKKKRIMKVAIIVLEILILAGLAVGYYVYSKMDNVQQGEEITKTEVKIDKKVDEKISKGYMNIALFGLDNRTSGNFVSGNSDVIIIASINQDTKEVKLLSVYRDTVLNLENSEKEYYFKANEAFNEGGPEQALRMLNSNLDLNITKYVAFNFDGVAEVVDRLGGVEVEVTDQEAIWMIGYMDDVEKMNGKKVHYLEHGGTYTLDGAQATAYARIRKESDDFHRTQRQRLIIEKLFEKAKKTDLTTLDSIINDVLSNYISTNLEKKELIDLASDAPNYTLGENAGFPFDKNETYLSDHNGKKQSCVIPCDLISNVKQLHSFLFGEADYEPTEGVQEISKTIAYKTGLTVDDAIVQQENGENKINTGKETSEPSGTNFEQSDLGETSSGSTYTESSGE